ncbi:hypothetical protein KIPB_005384 [Kipferlia bialata]|uniref:F5/8 type C domain-containing protein n=1 Tax=Kipferlia bialata TaxID=797122 RepID=A0A391NW55_9EUKA|nr:hypothetical protein KIPB_005384 [Kipferlia bialata]|eukprot:g5384.t1
MYPEINAEPERVQGVMVANGVVVDQCTPSVHECKCCSTERTHGLEAKVNRTVLVYAVLSVVLCVVTIVASSLISLSVRSTTKEYELLQIINEMSTAVNDNTNAMDTVTDAYAALYAAIAALQVDMEGVSDTYHAQSLTIATHDGVMTGYGVQLASLADSASATDTVVAALETRVSDAETVTALNTSTVSAMAERQEETAETLTAVRDESVTSAAVMSQMQRDVSALEGRVDGVEDELAQVEAVQAVLSTRIDSVEAKEADTALTLSTMAHYDVDIATLTSLYTTLDVISRDNVARLDTAVSTQTALTTAMEGVLATQSTFDTEIDSAVSTLSLVQADMADMDTSVTTLQLSAGSYTDFARAREAAYSGVTMVEAVETSVGTPVYSSVLGGDDWSSEHSLTYRALSYNTGCWRPRHDTVGQWITHVFNSVMAIAAVATAGRPTADTWTTSYAIEYYSPEAQAWLSAVPGKTSFVGNTDRNTIVVHTFSEPVISDRIRIVALEWRSDITLRYEVYAWQY